MDDSVIYHTTSNQNHIKLILKQKKKKKRKDFGYEVLEKLGFESLGIWNTSSEKKKKKTALSGCEFLLLDVMAGEVAMDGPQEKKNPAV
jgi:hypothetical protein